MGPGIISWNITEMYITNAASNLILPGMDCLPGFRIISRDELIKANAEPVAINFMYVSLQMYDFGIDFGSFQHEIPSLYCLEALCFMLY